MPAATTPAMTASAALDDIVRKLNIPDTETKLKVDAAVNLRDGLDLYINGAQYPVFLERLMPSFIGILRGPGIFNSTSMEQKLRSCILEILHRLPTNQTSSPEFFEPYAAEIVDLLMQLVRNDNEDNATLCIKIISDIMRHQPKALQTKVQHFMDLIHELFTHVDRVVTEQLDCNNNSNNNNTMPSNSSNNNLMGGPSTPGSSQSTFQSPRPGSPVASVSDLGQDLQHQSRLLVKGTQSFKVLSECPIIVVSVFQTYRSIIQHNVKLLVPLIKAVLCLQAPAQEDAHLKAKARGTFFAGVSPSIKNRAAFGDFITAQVKTMSFLAYLLRQYSSLLADFLPTLPEIVVRLLRDCPREKSGARKELLVAIRHIINFNFRKIFLHSIEQLLDERTLIGDGLTVYETMRPLAYSMLADLIHHVREQLTPEQIRKTVEVYTRNLQDNFPGTSFQTMSAKLLLNMAECIANMPNKTDARHYLLMILNAIGDKFAALNRQYPNAVKLSKSYQWSDEKPDTYLADKEPTPDWDETDIFNATPIKTANPRDRHADPVADNKFLFKNLMNGLKNMFYQLKACNTAVMDPQNVPQGLRDMSYGFSAEEVKVIVKLFREGAYVFRYYEPEKPMTESQYTSPVEIMANFYMVSSGKEEKDLLETFATVFHCIDPATFHEVFQQEIPHLYDMIFEHTALLHIPQFFLASEATSPSFCGMLLKFLMERIGDVGSADVKKASILLRLFKLAFMAVTLFSSQNEPILLPHVVDIMTKSIELSTKAQEPMNYFILLRSLFRSIGGGKFEHLYKQILPLLEMLLDVLNNLLMAARRPSERDLFVELCLTVPARLSNLLPHLSYLMRPLIVALRAGQDLVGQGLRTLELCVDNLTSDYLDAILAPVIEDLMNALFEHLKPHPYTHFHAHTTVRILGKLGGRNRKFMTGISHLDFQKYSDDPPSFDVRLIGSKHDRAFHAGLGIDSAIRKLTEVPKQFKLTPPPKQTENLYKRLAFQFIKAQIKLRVGMDHPMDDLPRLLRLQAQDLVAGKCEVDLSAFDAPDRSRSVAKKDEHDEIMKRLIKALMFAHSLPELRGEAEALLVNLSRHFTIIEFGHCSVESKKATSPFDVAAGEGPLFVDTRVLCDAVVESLASELPEVREAAFRVIQVVYDSSAIIFGCKSHNGKLAFFSDLCSKLCHACYEEEWFIKTAGTLGIRYLLADLDLGDEWAIAKQMDVIRALMYIIKDMPQVLPDGARTRAQETLELLLPRITKDATKEDVIPPVAKPGQPMPKMNRLTHICVLLNDELPHMNKHVRDTAKRSLELIANAVNAEVWELLMPHKDRLLHPIYMKPLRALPFSTQIGCIDVVTYYMSLKPDFVAFDESLNRLLMESLALADASDETLAGKHQEFRTHDSIVNLRVACIKILHRAMCSDDFLRASNNRTKIIGVLFKCLYSESNPTFEAANESLKSILPTNKLPKELLQAGLRPVLGNLQEAKRLTTHGLDNLARLLRLLTTYFKVEIGGRLLDHINTLVEGQVLQQMSFQFFEQNHLIKIIAAVFNIFHLLPPAAAQFKERIIDMSLDLEEKLRRTHHSPFRPPLYKYLNRFPQEIWKFLVARVEVLKYGRFLAQVLLHPDSQPLREYAAGHVDILIKTCNDVVNAGKETRYIAIVSTINVLESLSSYLSTQAWLEGKDTVAWLKQVGKDLERQLKANQLAPNLRLPADQAAEQLMSMFTKALSRNPSDLDSLLRLIDSVTAGDFRATAPLFTYLYEKVICSESTDFWRSVILRCLDVYSSKPATQKTKYFLLHNIVNPIMAMDVMRQRRQPEQSRTQKLLDRAIIESINAKIWRVNLGDPQEELAQPGSDHTRMEVLQLSAMLVKYHHVHLQEARKDIIKFGWTYIRLDDLINKHAAYVVIAYFIAHYETPPKIVTQVLHSLLKTNQNEGRVLVTQALELLAPILPKRLPTVPGDRSPVWAMASRRILAEEGQNVQQMTCIFHFLVRHPDLFYESRDKFVPLIIVNLRKVCSPPTSSMDSRRLALNMMWLIWQWEQRRVEGMPGSSSDRDHSASPASRKKPLGNEPASSPSLTRLPDPSKEYQISDTLRIQMLKYLVELIASINERYVLPSAKPRDPNFSAGPAPPPSTEMCKKAMSILYNLLRPQYWGGIETGLYPNVTEVILASDKTTKFLKADPADKEYDEKFITNIINTLQVVRIILNSKPDEWIVKNMTSVKKVLEKCLKSDNPEIQECLHHTDVYHADKNIDHMWTLKSTVRRVLDALPEDVPMEDVDGESEPDSPTSEFITFLSSIATETINDSNFMAGINILWSLGEHKPSVIDQHIPALMKALQSKLARDHAAHFTSLAVAAAATQASGTHIRAQDPNTQATDATNIEFNIQSTLIIKAIEVIAWRIEILGDQRRPFLSVLATLVEKSQHIPLCEKTLQMVEGWIFRHEGTWPTLKEKTAVLHKMLSFEGRSDPTMLTKFLELVIRIYEDPKIARTELTVRLEQAFLIGLRAQDVDVRSKFMSILDKSVSKTASTRLSYVICSQNWDMLGDSFWLAQASQILLGATEFNANIQLHNDDFRIVPLSMLLGPYARDSREPSAMDDDKFDSLITSHRRFLVELGDVKLRDIMEPLGQLQHIDSRLGHELWVTLFPMFWAACVKEERNELQKGLVALMTKEYHFRQIDKRPNVIQSLSEGAAKAWPQCKLPPHVSKYLAKTYETWYTSLVQLENAAINSDSESPKVRESTLDALVEAYATVKEDDLFYGTWRRRCQFVESNAALSYEQSGMWDKAQKLYESAQIKARTAVIPFSQAEYMLWEDHWVLCAEKLQQWDILQDFAKHENLQDLLLECAWRNIDMWQNQEHRESLEHLIKGVMDAPTPRRAFFQSFMSLLKYHNAKTPDSQAEFGRVCDEAIQLSIRKWHQLPRRLGPAHLPMLHNFQQLVELQDANAICQSLASTNQQNLDSKSAELKVLLGTWRERLPNIWDDIIDWQDLVTWRQHIFGLINNTYLQLLPAQGQNNNGNSYAYRGYHETAWIINRFAHVARKHNLPEVCIAQLSRIYTLPNIEIQEAFLKLRQQAKCHYENPDELNSGLDVINNTNLNYFNTQQKAEFYTLKGMFLEKLDKKDEADQAYGTALYYDIGKAKAWAEWGYFNDRKFKQDPSDMNAAKQAVTSYLQAINSYRNGRARKLIARILWLLSLDDANFTIASGFDDFKSDVPVWYWVTFIPQLLTGLGHKEAKRVHVILLKIAKTYPQSLYFQLRTSREDLQGIKKNHEAKARQRAQSISNNKPNSPSVPADQDTSQPKPDSGPRPHTTNGEGSSQVKAEGNDEKIVTNGEAKPDSNAKRYPWEYVEEIMSTLKTAFPLLSMTMETMVDQIQKYFKCPPDDDAYRLIVALLNDGLAYVSRMPSSYEKDVKLPAATEANIVRFASTIIPAHIKKSFEADFVLNKPTMFEYIHKLRKWRDKFEGKLDRRDTHDSLERYSKHLSEFRYLKFDDVEIPGQYLQHRDKNQDFVRIDRFLPVVDLVRGNGIAHRRLNIRGSDGSLHSFAVQHPAARNCRREERILQLFRHLNQTLSRKKESRRRDLQFTLPAMIPLAPHIRIVQEDTTYVTLQGIYEDHCRRCGIQKDEPVLFTMEKLRAMIDQKQPKQPDVTAIRLEIMMAIQEKWVPNTVANDYFMAIFPQFSEFWLFRRSFSYQFSALTFMTYILFMTARYPQKINISRGTGKVWGSEPLSVMNIQKPYFQNTEAVPFRLTPSLQALMGPLALEGIFACSIMAIARCLTEPQFELEHSLTLFVRDEIIHWLTSSHRVGQIDETRLRETVHTNTDVIVKRATTIATSPSGNLPSNQTTIDLIAKAVNPLNLAQCDVLWMPYL